MGNDEPAAQQLIALFAQVLGQPLALRELTPEERARREERLRQRRLRRHPLHSV